MELRDVIHFNDLKEASTYQILRTGQGDNAFIRCTAVSASGAMNICEAQFIFTLSLDNRTA
jgi:hypothetical protein